MCREERAFVLTQARSKQERSQEASLRKSHWCSSLRARGSYRWYELGRGGGAAITVSESAGVNDLCSRWGLSG